MQIEDIYKLFLESEGICTDSRQTKKNTIFFSLKGKNFNGNLFADQALSQGCSFCVIDDKKYKKSEKYILVDDVLICLQELASLHRSKLACSLIAITGSNGKTTSKELISSVLRKKYNVLSTEGNLNNHIGVPLTLLKLNKSHHFAVIEMGANHLKEIELLCEIAKPNFGIITNIGKAHLEGFGSIDNILIGKTELYRYLDKNNGTVFVNSDDKKLSKSTYGLNSISYGSESIYAPRITIDDIYVNIFCLGITFKSNLIGKYQKFNLALAICIGDYFKIDKFLIQEAIQNYIPKNNRSQIIKTKRNKVLMDAYNANPNSMRETINYFDHINYEKKFLILGDMLELGDTSEIEHKEIINLITEKDYEFILVGDIFSSIKKENSFKNVDSVPKKNLLELEKYFILVKGSRSITLEKILNYL
tara:strand:+ start:89 stop:1345 length:1257 start_codon:yes stop_codon:yes gene_type:complete